MRKGKKKDMSHPVDTRMAGCSVRSPLDIGTRGRIRRTGQHAEFHKINTAIAHKQREREISEVKCSEITNWNSIHNIQLKYVSRRERRDREKKSTQRNEKW